MLGYALCGDLSALVISELGPAERRDELWRSTCFEAFVRADTADDYLEFNFAPSGCWAAYHFSGYRQSMRNAAVAAPDYDQAFYDDNEDEFYVTIELTEGQLASLPAQEPWRVALSVVLEATDGTKSYWALAHPPGKPDFHHAAGFSLEL